MPESKRLAAEHQQQQQQSATTAIVKPVLKKSLKSNIIDDIDEDELLADSPSPPSISQANTKKDPKSKVDNNTLKSIRTPITSTTATKTLFTNRRVIVRETSDIATSSEEAGKLSITHPTPTKGIFDRLEKKVIGVNEAAKRKIQRIVIKNTE